MPISLKNIDKNAVIIHNNEYTKPPIVNRGFHKLIENDLDMSVGVNKALVSSTDTTPNYLYDYTDPSNGKIKPGMGITFSVQGPRESITVAGDGSTMYPGVYTDGTATSGNLTMFKYSSSGYIIKDADISAADLIQGIASTAVLAAASGTFNMPSTTTFMFVSAKTYQGDLDGSNLTLDLVGTGYVSTQTEFLLSGFTGVGYDKTKIQSVILEVGSCPGLIYGDRVFVYATLPGDSTYYTVLDVAHTDYDLNWMTTIATIPIDVSKNDSFNIKIYMYHSALSKHGWATVLGFQQKV